MLLKIPAEGRPSRWQAALADQPELADVVFARQVDVALGRLADLGVGEGDVVAVKLSDRADVMVIVFAAQRLGATVTLIEVARGPIGTTRAVRASAATLLVTESTTDVSRALVAPVVAVVVAVGDLLENAAA